MKVDKIHYSRNLKLSLIISLFIIISLFSFLPKIQFDLNNIIPAEPLFNYSNVVPPTLQRERTSSKSGVKKPPTPLIIISTIIGEPDTLKDITISYSKTGQKSLGNSGNSINNENLSSGSFNQEIPRQLLEVLPKKIDESTKGRIDLSLKIGEDGKVKDYKVLDNTTGSEACLKNVLKAVYKSRWEPSTTKNDTAGYWLHKSYLFN